MLFVLANEILDGSYIKLHNDIYDNLNVTNEELTILVLLYRNYMQYKSIAICSIQMILDYMFVNISNNRKTIKTIKDSIYGLITKGYITNLYNLYYQVIEENNLIKNKDSLFYVELAIPPESNYFKVFDKDINSIFEYCQGENISKFNLIRYFIACKRVSNNDSNFGYLSQGKLKQLVSDSRSIQRYNKILQDDLHLIRYCNDYLTLEKHYATTFIGSWDDVGNFNIQVEAEVRVRGLVHTDKIKSNKRRSTKQKINNLINTDDKDARINELEEQLRQYRELQFKPVSAKSTDDMVETYWDEESSNADDINWDDDYFNSCHEEYTAESYNLLKAISNK